MPNDKTDKVKDILKEILQEMQTETVTPALLKQFITQVLAYVRDSKNEFETLSAENMEKVENAISFINSNIEKSLVKMEDEKTNFSKQSNIKFNTWENRILQLLNDLKMKEGKPGKDADEKRVVDKVVDNLSKTLAEMLPESETGESMVDKINDLPTDTDDYKIDASHIKNLPEAKGGVTMGGTRFLSRMADVYINNLQDGDVLTWEDSIKKWINVPLGGAVGEFVNNEIITGSGSGTDFTLDFAPIAGSLQIYALGQRLVPTTDYSVSGTTLTTVLSWEVGDLIADYRK